MARKSPYPWYTAEGFVRDGSAPLLQYAYGAYGLSTEPSFFIGTPEPDRPRFRLCHRPCARRPGNGPCVVRDDGRKLHKMNSFTDFIDVTRHLAAERYAAKDKVFAMGGSAGGLLVGAVANSSPADYRGIVAQVPFVDVVTTMLDDGIPLTTNEYDEWGNPRDRADYEYMLSYSPYDNVRAQGYPAMFVTTGLWDSQVQYYEPAKWIANFSRSRPIRTPCSSTSTCRLGTAASRGASSVTVRLRWSTPFYWTRPAPPAAFETSIRICRH